MRTRPSSRRHHAIPLAGIGVVLLIAGCAGQSKVAKSDESASDSNGLIDVLNGASTDFDNVIANIDLQNKADLAEAESANADAVPVESAAEDEDVAADAAEPEPIGDQIEPAAAVVTEPDAPVPVDPLPVASSAAGERIDELTSELAMALADSGESGDPVRDAIRLLGLELIAPESAVPELAALRADLSPEETRILDTLTVLLHALHKSEDPADQQRLAELLRDAAQNLPDGNALSVPTMLLCTRVERFGVYRPFASERFLAGRQHTVIVYTEITGFEQNAIPDERDPDGQSWQVELSQELTLISEADGHPAYHAPAERIREKNGAKRHDFFVTQRFALPGNLAIGRYRLKATVRDHLHGTAIAESSVPVEIVADSRLIGRR